MQNEPRNSSPSLAAENLSISVANEKPQKSSPNEPSEETLKRDAWLASRITAAEELKPGKPFSKASKHFLMEEWGLLLDLAGPQRFDEAFQHALRTSPYRPDTYDLRQYLGIQTTPPTEASAALGLQWVLTVLRREGVKRRIETKKILDPKTGEWAFEHYEREAPPAIPSNIRAALSRLGHGSVEAGLSLLYQHPALENESEPYPNAGLRMNAIEKLEARWLEAWKAAAHTERVAA